MRRIHKLGNVGRPGFQPPKAIAIPVEMPIPMDVIRGLIMYGGEGGIRTPDTGFASITA